MKMTKDEILLEMKSESLLNKLRVVFTGACEKMQQAGQQRKKPDIYEYRNLEFEAARKLLALTESHCATELKTLRKMLRVSLDRGGTLHRMTEAEAEVLKRAMEEE